MGKNDKRKPPNPGLNSTIWIDKRYITDMATAFSDCAEQLANGWHDPHDARINAIYTNAVLALELYFKSRLVKRVFDPTYMRISEDNQMIITTEEDYYNTEERDYSVVAQMHSRLVVPKKMQTHDVFELFIALPDSEKEIILEHVKEETKNISDMDSLNKFIESIKDYFVSKRYAFESFLEAIPKDSNYIYTVMPILRGVRKAFGYRTEN
ncbi:hypothetical protein SMZ63_002479 [Cronobacter sakazakii]|nr:hypothetical protein [Cronobacter sakazakii]ELY3747125.1 hypothetical protein [Cronobacter sakazakii]ELY3995940.1 hypothetical protein [Cronobacter sakazakii]ELY4094354.1 hypothetical protein [Cronobacter sakazakii]ELY4428856.1 hypothetical protein [Cronobacter sakazakii]